MLCQHHVTFSSWLCSSSEVYSKNLSCTSAGSSWRRHSSCCEAALFSVKPGKPWIFKWDRHDICFRTPKPRKAFWMLHRWKSVASGVWVHGKQQPWSCTIWYSLVVISISYYFQFFNYMMPLCGNCCMFLFYSNWFLSWIFWAQYRSRGKETKAWLVYKICNLLGGSKRVVLSSWGIDI